MRSRVFFTKGRGRVLLAALREATETKNAKQQQQLKLEHQEHKKALADHQQQLQLDGLAHDKVLAEQQKGTTSSSSSSRFRVTCHYDDSHGQEDRVREDANTKLSVITKQQEEGQEKRNEELLELATTRQRGLSTPRWVSSATPTTTPTGSICQPVPSSSPNLEESFASFTPASGDVLRPFWADWERRWKEGFCLHFGESSSTPVSVLPSPPRPW
jgi:hypothetical protein